jgi:hypothetical protein
MRLTADSRQQSKDMSLKLNGRDNVMENRDDVPINTSYDVINLDAEPKPLFRSTSPEKSYSAQSPYYDVLLYSFTPEERKETMETAEKRGGGKNEKTREKDERTNCSTKDKSKTDVIRDRLQQTGTNLLLNDNDIFGDGDQSPIKDTKVHETYINIFQSGTFARNKHYIRSISLLKWYLIVQCPYFFLEYNRWRFRCAYTQIEYES